MNLSKEEHQRVIIKDKIDELIYQKVTIQNKIDVLNEVYKSMN